MESNNNKQNVCINLVITQSFVWIKIYFKYVHILYVPTYNKYMYLLYTKVKQEEDKQLTNYGSVGTRHIWTLTTCYVWSFFFIFTYINENNL